MDPYYHHTILQQGYYTYGFPVSPGHAPFVPYDQLRSVHYAQYVDDVAVLNTMWMNQETYNASYTPINPYVPYGRPGGALSDSLLLEERLIMQELEADAAAQQLTTSGSGLSEEKISEHLHVYTEKGKMIENCEGEEVDSCCCICLGEYEKNEKMGRLDCGHGYHEDCIKRWLLSKNVCPMCRSTALMV
ncbi:hypothetical protein L1987_61594 [Smallanthus sonchifolius]|uniref:Uncharacterized protein n=1 Tax=Smallanthus sonchifolius TaxID=185202 RepID=A0ACB9C817_9ASTR|nr:hypothetical protein L1987_61594 [Smallanthus sonchifolius]